jgi:excisionase family DNA binding protein
MNNLTMSIDEVGEMLGCKRTRVFQLLKDGTLDRAPRFGRDLRILRASVERALVPPVPRNRSRKTVQAPAPVRLSDLKW